MDDIFSMMLFIWIVSTIVGAFRKKPEQNEEVDLNLEPNQNFEQIEIPASQLKSNFNPNQNPNSKLKPNSKSKPISNITESETFEPKVNQESYLNFTSDDAMNAIILSAIFNKPKSKR